MRIRKWYADCITAEGTVFVGYAARLGLGPATLPYQCSLTGDRGAKPELRWALASRGMPSPDPHRIDWSSSELQLSGHWTQTSRPIHRTLLEARAAKLEWHCHMPAARTDLRVGGRHLTGLGYAEELLFEGDPRRIPIRHLRWGRFVGEDTSVVWIEWQGPRPLTLVYHDGIEMEGGSVSDEFVSFGAYTLPLGGPDAWTLRDDVAEESIFPNRRWLRRLLPRSLAKLHEVKWAGPGCLEGPQGSTSPGWVIYERVDWP